MVGGPAVELEWEFEFACEFEFELEEGIASRIGTVMLLSSLEVLLVSAKWSKGNLCGVLPPSDMDRVFLAGVLSGRRRRSG